MKVGNSTPATLDENSAQISVLTGGLIDGYGIPNQGDDNIFNQRFAINTHTTYNAAAAMKKALEHQNFMVCGTVANPSGSLPANTYSFVSNNDANSLIWAVKPGEEGINSGTITRLWLYSPHAPFVPGKAVFHNKSSHLHDLPMVNDQ